MKAMVMRAYGPPDVLRLEEVPTPVPGPGEVLIRVHAVTVNRTLDLVVRAGEYARKPALPHVLGVDPTGTIEAVGPGVTERKPGDRVVSSLVVKPATAEAGPVMLGVHLWGGYAEFVVVPAAITSIVPDGLDFATAAVVARHGPLAFRLLGGEGQVEAGQWVLVMGAAGGLGSAGVQAAKSMGARVIGAAGGDDRVRTGLELGADAGINYRTQDLTAEVMRITGGRGVDVVFENMGDAELFPKALASLARYGRMVTAGAHAGRMVPLDLHHLYLNGLRIIGSTRQTPADVDHALAVAADGRFRVLIDRVMPLSEAVRAHEIVAARESAGKVVLDPTRT
jgi:NADPH:quinone reductase-like Zn-dependent oxidoreductase